MGDADPFGLSRFLVAQEPVLPQVLAELRAGAKRSHWMWFVFPQLAGLGRSPTAQFYGITGVSEARGYLAHPVLGTRLVDCVALANAVPSRSAHDIFGSPDDLKFHSCVSLFGLAQPDQPVFHAALVRYFGGLPDAATVRLLATPSA